MANKKIDVDMLLRSAMSSTETPALDLVQKVKYRQIKEEPTLKKTTIRRSFSAVAADPEKAQQYLDTMWDYEGSRTVREPIVDTDSNITLNLVESGYVSKQVMTYDALTEWTENQLKETQKMVDRGEYSQANMELDRQSFAEKLKDARNGNIVTLYTYADGSYSLATTYPDSGFNADVDASGGIVITD